MANAKRVTPGRKGYKILFAENTVIMNKKFAAAAAEYGTVENITLYHIRNDFPGMKEVLTRISGLFLRYFSFIFFSFQCVG